MPQRAKTPPPPQDEIFMTIFYPYPQHANMEVEEDFERVARWLGTIVAPAYFNAFYHKPSVSPASRLSHETFSPPARLPTRLSRPTCTHARGVCAHFGAHLPGLSPTDGPLPGESDINTMDLFASSSQARNTVIIEVSKSVHDPSSSHFTSFTFH